MLIRMENHGKFRSPDLYIVNTTRYQLRVAGSLIKRKRDSVKTIESGRI